MAQIFEAKENVKPTRKPLALAVAIVSVIVTLVGVFALADWAEAAPLYHGLQHVMIFVGGAGFGAALMYLVRKGGSHEG